MQHLVIDKVFEHANMTEPAKHYRLKFIGYKVYILKMSRARPKTYVSKNSLIGIITEKLLGRYEAKFANEYEQSLIELQNIGVDKFVKKKYCFVVNDLTKDSININRKNNTIKFSFWKPLLHFTEQDIKRIEEHLSKLK